MSLRKNLTIVVASSLLLSMVSCGNDSKTSSKKSQANPICNGIECMSSIDWKITLQGQMFPEKTRLVINGETVLDECMGKQQYRIDREAAPQSISLPQFYVPKGKLKIKVIDQGWGCQENKAFIVNDAVSFEVMKSDASRSILINL